MLALALALTALLGATAAAAQPREGRAAVQLIADDLDGRSVWVDAAVEDLHQLGFNDAVSRVEIRRGRWELCSDGGFQGECQVYGPGHHRLPPALRNRLSSLRPQGLEPQPDLPGRPGRPEPGGAVVLYEHPDFSGRTLAVGEAVSNLATHDFNDRLSALEIRRGRWELCRHADFGGECIVLGPGRHTLQRRLQDEISSLRPLAGSGPSWPDDRPGWDQGDGHRHPGGHDGHHGQTGPGAGGGSGGAGAAVLLLDGDGRRARTLQLDAAVDDLRAFDFDDRARWVEVRNGQWLLCSQPGYRGSCLSFGPGRHRLPPGLAARLSSLRPR